MSLVMTGAVEMAHTAAQGAVDVDFDLTVLGQMALFLVLLVILKPTLFDPMLKLFAEREIRIDGAKDEARKLDKKSSEAKADYEAAMQKAREAGNAEQEKLRGEALKTENEILARVRESTAKTLDEGRKQAQAEVVRARSLLREQSKDLAREIASRVLGREVQR
jgi:F-type H+-transporting ATPase subunit b